MRGVNDNSRARAGRRFVGSTPALFLPALAVIGAYGLILAALVASGRQDGALARLCMVVLGVGGPFLLAHALLVRFTLRVDLLSHAAYLNQGFPARDSVEVAYARIGSVAVSRGLSSRVTNSGTLVVGLVDGRRFALRGIGDPDVAAEALAAEVGRALSGAGGEPPREHDGLSAPGGNLAAHF